MEMEIPSEAGTTLQCMMHCTQLKQFIEKTDLKHVLNDQLVHIDKTQYMLL